MPRAKKKPVPKLSEYQVADYRGRIRSWLPQRNISISRFATMCDRSRANLSNWLSRGGPIKTDTIQRMLDAMLKHDRKIGKKIIR